MSWEQEMFFTVFFCNVCLKEQIADLIPIYTMMNNRHLCNNLQRCRYF